MEINRGGLFRFVYNTRTGANYLYNYSIELKYTYNNSTIIYTIRDNIIQRTLFFVLYINTKESALQMVRV